MSERLTTPPTQFIDLLPPKKYRLHSVAKDGLIPTPTDERGLVDATALLQEMAKTVDPSYNWKSPFNDIHHLQWYKSLYPDEPDSELVNPHMFRNLAISKWVLPRVLHNWIHFTTEPPPVPEPEVMFYRSEAQRVTTSLFMSIESSRNITRLTEKLTEHEIQDKLMIRFDDFRTRVDSMQNIPPEFRLVDLSQYRQDSIDDMFKIGTALGSCALTGTVKSAMTIVRGARAA